MKNRSEWYEKVTNHKSAYIMGKRYYYFGVEFTIETYITGNSMAIVTGSES